MQKADDESVQDFLKRHKNRVQTDPLVQENTKLNQQLQDLNNVVKFRAKVIFGEGLDGLNYLITEADLGDATALAIVSGFLRTIERAERVVTEKSSVLKV